MIKQTIAALAAIGMSAAAVAGTADDPLVYHVMIDKLEVRNTDEANPVVVDVNGWIGKDLHKFWFKTEVEYVDSETEEAEVQFLYSRAIAPFWDFQAGWRRDIRPEPERDYLALGFKGLAPYLFEVDMGVFIGKSGQVGLRFDAEYEYMLTQKLVLSPEIEINAYSQDDEELGIGAGLSNMDLGLRMRYEIKRELAFYIGVNWPKTFTQIADQAEEDNPDGSNVQVVTGLSAWF